MYERRQRPHEISPPPPDPSIPGDQLRALDRRHALDAQQRAFRGGVQPGRPSHRRPPT